MPARRPPRRSKARFILRTVTHLYWTPDDLALLAAALRFVADQCGDGPEADAPARRARAMADHVDGADLDTEIHIVTPARLRAIRQTLAAAATE